MIRHMISVFILFACLTRDVTCQQNDTTTITDSYDTLDDDDIDMNTNLVIHLTDSNLGSLTQIDSTSMTSGDWFIMFYAPWCSHCQSLHPTWSQLANELNGLVNVAAVDAIDNELSAHRFEIKGFPTLYYLHHHGQMFEYEKNDRSVDALKEWALQLAQTNDANTLQGKPIPRPLSLWKQLEAHLTEWAIEMERVITQRLSVALSLIAFGILLGVALTSVIMLFTLDQPAPPTYRPIPQVKKAQ